MFWPLPRGCRSLQRLRQNHVIQWLVGVTAECEPATLTSFRPQLTCGQNLAILAPTFKGSRGHLGAPEITYKVHFKRSRSS